MSDIARTERAQGSSGAADLRRIELRHLRYFIAVAEAGSVVAGARSVGIVQPALSRQIQELEEAIGTPLLRRLPKGVELTAAGTGFLRDARQLLAGLQASRERAQRSAAGLLGELRLGVQPNYLALPAVAALLQVQRFAEVLRGTARCACRSRLVRQHQSPSTRSWLPLPARGEGGGGGWFSKAPRPTKPSV